MNEPILLGFGLLLFLFTWRHVVCRTVLDRNRDKLFDLRQQARAFYASRPNGLEDKTYGQLRLLLNDQIRFLDTVSIYRLSFCEQALQTNSDLRECIHEALAERFATPDKDVAEFIKKVRRSAYNTVMSYVIFSSVPTTLLLCVMFVPALTFLVLRDCLRSFKLSLGLISRAFMGVARRMIPSDVVEGYSSLSTSENRVNSELVAV